MSRAVLAFWYDFASHYSWLTARRIESAAAAADVRVVWEPFLLGPIFAGQGWTTSPFNIYLAKGAHAWRDVERQAVATGLTLVRPEPFPQHSLLAARTALALPQALRGGFSARVFQAEFEEGLQISAPETLAAVVAALGEDPQAVLARAGSDAIKADLRRQVERATAAGLFGAPTFLTADGEMFWGNDRLESALAWAVDGPPPGLARQAPAKA